MMTDEPLHMIPDDEGEYGDLCDAFAVYADSGHPELFAVHVQKNFGLTEAEAQEWLAKFTANYDTFRKQNRQ
jgi:hypothetical protein